MLNDKWISLKILDFWDFFIFLFKLWNIHSSTLFKKSNFCPKIEFWQKPNIFTSFWPNFFRQFSSWNQSCQQLKSPKPQHFHEFFTQKDRQFSREIKVEFLDKKWRFRTVWARSARNIAKVDNFSWISGKKHVSKKLSAGFFMTIVFTIKSVNAQ